MAATYALTIAGSSKTLQAGSLRMLEQQNARGQLEFQVLDTAGAYRPALDDEVLLTENGSRIFGGTIIATKESGHPSSFGGTPIVILVECADFNALADRVYVNVTIPDGTTVYDALNTYILPYLSPLGVTLHSGQVTGGTLPELRYEYVVASQVLDDIAQFAGNWTREIDYTKTLRIFDQSTQSAPFNIAANDGHVIGDITVEPSREKYANRVIVRYNEAARKSYAWLDGSAGGAAVADGNTVTIGSRAYTFQSTLTNTNGNVQIGGSLADTLNNLIAAITGGGTPGTDYAAATTINTQVEAWLQRTLFVGVRAITAGSSGNSIGVATTATLSWITEGGIPTSTLWLGADESLTNTVTIDDAVEQASHGVWEDVIEADTDVAATASARGTAYLAQSTESRKIVTYTTRSLGIQPAMTQGIVLPRRDLNANFTVQSVETFEGRRGVLHRLVTLLEGSTVQSSWRDVYKQWASGGGGASVVAGGGGGTMVVSGGGGAIYMLATSALEAVRSATPTWVSASAIRVTVDTTIRGNAVGTVRVRVKARAGGTVQARLYNVSDAVSAGVGDVKTGSSFQDDVFAVNFSTGAKQYELQLLPGTANEDVTAVGYLE